MPPVRRVICKVNGCGQPIHIYPSGSRASYCREHIRLRKTIRNHQRMTGAMLDVLRHLRDQKAQDNPFVVLSYPLAHRKTLRLLIERDWIFESPGLDGVRYCITSRGLKALKPFETPVQRRDGICPRCNVNPRPASRNGSYVAYCIECERERGRIKSKKYPAKGDPNRPCSRCKKRPRRVYAGGGYSSYCAHCERVLARRKQRKNRRIRAEKVHAGIAPVPMCPICRVRPRKVFARSLSNYCAVCGPKQIRRYKLSRALRMVGR